MPHANPELERIEGFNPSIRVLPTPGRDVGVTALKKRLPIGTTLKSSELREIADHLKEEAFFSARVSIAEVVQKLKTQVEEILGAGEQGMSIPEARLALKEYLPTSGYQAPAGEAGTIADLTTSARQNLVLKTQIEMAQGLGWKVAGQSRAVLDAYPAQELYRAVDKTVPRDWQERWQAAGGTLFDGRLIARKDSEVWQSIGDGAGGYTDTLGNDFPPFAFNSGMDLRDVPRAEAIELGVITAEDEVQPSEVDAGEILSKPEVTDESLRDSLLDTLGGGFSFKEGVLSKA